MSEQLLQQIIQKLDRIENDQQAMKSDMGSMKSELGSMKSELGSMKETQALMQSQLSETNAIVRAIRDRQEETDAKLDALSMDVHKLHGELTHVKEGQERHERILEKLSLRSIEQETDISALRRAK
ncbi:hypothetical protein [Paenibacillus sp. GM2]|uniref:hypothetical protein n=1 Tax=Paenibacillus sp. GM2 TaxID=1622070 RepID=UPI000A7D5DCF|nr:hypothetical protein [Paenibacillus sp. GM2]